MEFTDNDWVRNADDDIRLEAGIHTCFITNVRYNEEYKALYIKFENDEASYIYKQNWDVNFKIYPRKFTFRRDTLVHIFDIAMRREGYTLDVCRRSPKLAEIAKALAADIGRMQKIDICLKENVYLDKAYIGFDVINKPFVFESQEVEGSGKPAPADIELSKSAKGDIIAKSRAVEYDAELYDLPF